MYFLALSLLFSCQGTSNPSSTDDVGSSTSVTVDLALLTPTGSCPVVVESIGAGEDMNSISPYESFQRSDEATVLVNEHRQTEHLIGPVQQYDAMRLTAEQMMLALDGEIWLMREGELVYSPINDVLPVPIQQVEVVDGIAWLLGAGRLFRWIDEELREVSIDPEQNILSMIVSSPETLAITTPGLEVIEMVDSVLQLQTVPNLLPISIGATASQRLLVSEGDAEIHLYHDRVWTRFEIDGVGEVDLLMSDSESDVVWIQGLETSVVYDRGQVCTIDVDVNGDWLDVDQLGRLTVVKDGSLYRYSIGRPVAVVGMLSNERLDISREIFFLPTLGESLIDLSVWVGTEQLEVNAEANSTLLNPEAFGIGAHSLRMVAEGADGASITEFPFVVGGLSETSWDDVESIYLDN